ncbi:unnamed protein product [Coregonus sp. 'balchen']|nr:unnamed protein product [Coregonus sp. 'balchen']
MPEERPCILSPPKERRVYRGLNLVHIRADGRELSGSTSTQDLQGSGNNYIHKSQHQDHESPETGQCWFRSKGDDVSEWASVRSYWRPSLTDRKRWSNILAENKENSAAPSTPKRLKQGSRSSS